MEETGTNSQSRMFEKMGELPERTTQRMYSLLMEEGVLRPGSVTISNLNANLRKELGVVLAEFGLNRQDPLRTNRPLGSAGVDAVVDTEDESVDVPLGRSRLGRGGYEIYLRIFICHLARNSGKLGIFGGLVF